MSNENRRPVVTVAALVEREDGKVLVIRSHKWRDMWCVPGGKIDYGETYFAALRREFMEETGLEIYDIRRGPLQEAVLSEEFHKPEHFIFLNFFARTRGTDVVLNDEAEEYRWVSPEEALTYRLNTYTRVLIEYFLHESHKIS